MTTLMITHPQLVATLVKPPHAIMISLTLDTTDLWHGATGVAGEAGELLEAILFPPEKGVDRDNLREELGDLYFYIEQLRQRVSLVFDMESIEFAASNVDFERPFLHLVFAAEIAVHGSQVLDTVKKAAIYNKPLDKELLLNQLMALQVSMRCIENYFSITREDAVKYNIAKLSKRYASLSYSDQQAQDRADKQPRTSDMADVVRAEIGENLQD